MVRKPEFDTAKRSTILSSLDRRAPFKEDSASPIEIASHEAQASCEFSPDGKCSWPILAPVIAGELKELKKVGHETRDAVSEIRDFFQTELSALKLELSPVKTKVNLGQWLLASVVVFICCPVIILIITRFVK